ncbi:TPA: acyltransferase family protein [Yersinia enterocolitica]
MRDLRIDIFRGVCVLFVVLGHTDYLPKPIFDYIYSFHMPAFFILSGYLFNTNKKLLLSERVLGRFKRLIIPAWVLGLVCGIPFLYMLLTGTDGITLEVFVTKLYGTLTGYPSYSNTFNCTPLWFLYSLFVVDVIASSLYSYNKKHALFLLYVLGVLGMVLSQYNLPVTPFNLLISMMGLLFFAIGITLRSLNEQWSENITVLSFTAAVFFIGNFLSTTPVNMAAHNMGDGFTIVLNIVIAVSGTATIYFISGYLKNIKYVTGYISWVGVNTIPIIAFDYYANNIISLLHRSLNLHAYPLINFILKVILLSCIAFLLSKSAYLNKIVNGK